MNNLTKKLLSILLLLAVCCSFFCTGCGKNLESEKKDLHFEKYASQQFDLQKDVAQPNGGESVSETAANEPGAPDAEAATPASGQEQKEEAQAAKTPTCTISISCATVNKNLSKCDPAKRNIVPSDGWILKPRQVTFSKGESVFDVLKRVCKEQGIPLEFTNSPSYGAIYIEGIANLYEFDVGELSGWMYSVNGWFPNYGCSSYELSDGDVIRWQYSCDLGEDIGGSNYN